MPDLIMQVWYHRWYEMDDSSRFGTYSQYQRWNDLTVYMTCKQCNRIALPPELIYKMSRPNRQDFDIKKHKVKLSIICHYCDIENDLVRSAKAQLHLKKPPKELVKLKVLQLRIRRHNQIQERLQNIEKLKRKFIGGQKRSEAMKKRLSSERFCPSCGDRISGSYNHCYPCRKKEHEEAFKRFIS